MSAFFAGCPELLTSGAGSGGKGAGAGLLLEEQEALLGVSPPLGSFSALDVRTQEFVQGLLKQQAAENVVWGEADAVVPHNTFRRQALPKAEEAYGGELHAGMIRIPPPPVQDMEAFKAVPYFGQQAGAAAAGALPGLVAPGVIPMMYGGSPGAYPGPILSQPFPVQPSVPGPSKGALARQQRASADSKRGKRRRAGTEGGTTTSAAATVPEMAAKETSTAQIVPTNPSGPPVSKVKEERRKKRLLRNRVSAQQARERKRMHITELEQRCNEMEKSNAYLEQRAMSLTKENEELRHIVKSNMRSSVGTAANVDGPST